MGSRGEKGRGVDRVKSRLNGVMTVELGGKREEGKGR